MSRVMKIKCRILTICLSFLIFFSGCERYVQVPNLKEEEMSFVVFSDVQQGYGVFSKLARNIGSLNPVPVAAFCCGDLMLRSANEAEWLSFRDASDPITRKMPLFIARGNHEGNDPVSEEFLHSSGGFPANDFYFKHREKNVLFIVLDTYERLNISSILGKQLTWLENQLDSAASDTTISHVFLFMHQPLYPQGKHKGENLVNADELHQLFLKHHKIRVIFSGHDHIFNKYEKNGLIYLTTGGGGGIIYYGYGGDYHHFVKVTLFRDTPEINIKTIDILNETIDEFNL